MLNTNFSYKELFQDIRFWIVLFFLIRLIGITNPPLEVSHNWRQTSVTSVARNFLEIDNNILYPRIDIAGEKSGITGMEFPIFNYSIYITAKVFGWQHWYGRLINLIISSFGIWFFYALVRKYFPEKMSFYATMILIVSVWFQFSRKIMPDTFSMSFVITALYFGINYLEGKSNRRFTNLILYAILLLFGILSKLPSGYILSIIPLLLYKRSIPFRRKLIFLSTTLLSIIPSFIWYFYWVPYLVEYYGFWHFFMGKPISQGAHEVFNNIPQALSRFYEIPVKIIGFAVFLFGTVYAIVKKDKTILGLLALSFFGFFIVILKAGNTFLYHDYYIIPFVPIITIVVAYGLTKLEQYYQHLSLILIIAISVEGIANQYHDFFIKPEYLQLLKLEEDLDTFSEPEDLILINCDEYPTPMYFAHRKGWVAYDDQILSQNFLDSLSNLGLRNIVIMKKIFGNDIKLDNNNVLLENDIYRIYSVDNTQE